MDLSQLNELDLDPQNMGEWPVVAKGILVVLLCVIAAGAWYYFVTSDQLMRLERDEQKEVSLRKTFESKQKKAVNLDAYRQQLAEMQESFGAMLRQLPDKTEVAALLVDVSQTGLAAGLEFELFQPMDEQLKDFYAELPIRVRVIGHYRQFGNFISGLAALPRIVTIHDVKIGERGGKKGKRDDEPLLTLDATVKTYRYLDEESAK